MASAIEWESDYEKALRRSGTEGKPVLLDFYNPG